MKKYASILLLLLLVTTASTQTISEEALIGKWKVTAFLTAKRVTVDLTSRENCKKLLYEQRILRQPGKVITASDSAEMEIVIDEMFSTFSTFYIHFTAGKKFSGKLDTEELKGKFRIANNRLELTENGNTESDSFNIRMPDENTLVLNFADDKDIEMTLVRND